MLHLARSVLLTAFFLIPLHVSLFGAATMAPNVSTPSSTTPAKPATPAPATTPSKPAAPAKKVQNTPVNPSEVFTQPGIVFFKNGKWLGSDYLLNLSSDLKIIAEIVKSQNNESLPLQENALANIVSARLKQAGLNPSDTILTNQLVTPFLHVLVLVQNIEKAGYAVSCHLSLFEVVKLERVTLTDEVSFQAITWDKETLLLVPVGQAVSLIEKAVGDLTDEFIKRFEFFEKLQKSAEIHYNEEKNKG